MPYISELDVSTSGAEEKQLLKQGFMKLTGNLDEGTGGSRIFLWYKEDKERSEAITRLQVSFNREMTDGLISAGYTQIPKDLNAGAGGNPIYLWYLQGSGEYHTPIVDIRVTTDANSEATKFGPRWERVACDLNREGGCNWIHVWIQREKQTYICDVTATDSYGSDSDKLKAGYIRVDEDTNRGAVRGSPVFIWYRETTDSQRALNNLKVSLTDRQYRAYQNQSYQPVSVNLNEGTGGNNVYLWYKKEGSNSPIKSITLLLNTALVPAYKIAGLTVIERNLNEGNNGHTEYLCVLQ